MSVQNEGHRRLSEFRFHLGMIAAAVSSTIGFAVISTLLVVTVSQGAARLTTPLLLLALVAIGIGTLPMFGSRPDWKNRYEVVESLRIVHAVTIILMPFAFGAVSLLNAFWPLPLLTALSGIAMMTAVLSCSLSTMDHFFGKKQVGATRIA